MVHSEKHNENKFFCRKKMYGNRLDQTRPDQTRIKNRLKKADCMREEWLNMINAKDPVEAAYWRDMYRKQYGEVVEGPTYEEAKAKAEAEKKARRDYESRCFCAKLEGRSTSTVPYYSVSTESEPFNYK